MATKTVLYKEAMRELDKIKTINESEYRERKERVYEKFPRLQEIDHELSLQATNSMRLILSSNTNPEEAMEHLRAAQLRLQQEKDEILEKNNLPKTVFDPQYSCMKCQDSGYINEQRCTCLQQKIMDKIYDQSNVRQRIRTDNFTNFSLDVYGDSFSNIYEKSPRENARGIFRECLSFIEQFPSGNSLLMTGATGLGKTFLCNCIAGDLLEKGFVVLYFTAGQLFRKLEEQRFENNTEDTEEFKEWDNDLLEADLLIIDDLGTEFSTVFTKAELFRIINDRQLAKKSIIISTNLSQKELHNVYSDRTMSRIAGEFVVMKFFGDDIRVFKRFQK